MSERNAAAAEAELLLWIQARAKGGRDALLAMRLLDTITKVGV